jgi:hypothetical protein
VTSDDEPQFRGYRKNHVEVSHRQQQVALLPKPCISAVGAALTTGAIATRMVTQMLGAAVTAAGDVSAHLLGAAQCNITQSTDMTRQYGSTEPRDVARAVPANHVG